MAAMGFIYSKAKSSISGYRKRPESKAVPVINHLGTGITSINPSTFVLGIYGEKETFYHFSL